MPQSGGSVYFSGGSWWARIRYTDLTGRAREKRRKAKSKRHGGELLKVLLAKVAVELGEPASVTVFVDLLEHYRALYVKPPVVRGRRVVSGLRSWRTVAGHCAAIESAFRSSLIHEMTPASIESFRSSLVASGRSIATANRILATLRRIFYVGQRDGLVSHVPFGRGHRLISVDAEEPRERVLSGDEERRLLEVCLAPPRRHLWLKIVLALETGMREAEILGLTRGAIDLPRRRIEVSTTRSKRHEIGGTKTEEVRVVPISRQLFDALEAFAVGELAPDEWVIRSGLSTRTAWRTSCRLAGIEGLQFRDLRTSAGMRMISRGVPHEIVAKILGHHDTRTTFRWYTQMHDESLDQARRAMDGHGWVTELPESSATRDAVQELRDREPVN